MGMGLTKKPCIICKADEGHLYLCDGNEGRRRPRTGHGATEYTSHLGQGEGGGK